MIPDLNLGAGVQITWQGSDVGFSSFHLFVFFFLLFFCSSIKRTTWKQRHKAQTESCYDLSPDWIGKYDKIHLNSREEADIDIRGWTKASGELPCFDLDFLLLYLSLRCLGVVGVLGLLRGLPSGVATSGWTTILIFTGFLTSLFFTDWFLSVNKKSFISTLDWFFQSPRHFFSYPQPCIFCLCESSSLQSGSRDEWVRLWHLFSCRIFPALHSKRP